MPYPIIVTRAKDIRPPEAAEIAGQLRSAAASLSVVLPDLYRAESEMDMTWQGNARNEFVDVAGSPARRLELLAEDLRELARAIEAIEVTIWEEQVVYVPD